MADEIIRLDYSAEDIGDNIDEVRTARGTFDTLDDRLDNIEGGGPSPSNPIASNCVSPMTGYSKSSSSTPGNISTSDTLNAAIGKLEKRTEINENNILSLLPTSYSLPTLIDGTTCTINEGGYITVGNIIVVNVTFTTSVSYTAYSSIMQFPVPKSSGSITMVAAAHIDSSVNVAVNKYGQIALFDTPLPAGTYHFFTVYLKQ